MRSILFCLFTFCLVSLLSCVAVAVEAKATDKNLETIRKAERISRETDANWKIFCAHCHGSDGRPQALIELPMPDAPDFHQADWADYELDDLVSSITDGTGKMPAFQGMLSKSEIRNLSALVVRFPKGRSGTLIAKQWRYRQRDQELREAAAD